MEIRPTEQIVSSEFKNDIIRILNNTILLTESSIDEDENIMVIGLISHISNALREYLYNRNSNK